MDHLRKWLLLFSCAVLAASAAPRLSLDPVTERRVTIGETAAIHLVKAGVADFEVAISKTANPRVRQAGEQLCQLLSQITGTLLEPIAQASGSRPVFLVGDLEVAKALGIDPAGLDCDGFVIRTHEKQILLLGSDAADATKGYGTLYAVYDFLERFAGARFFFPGDAGTILPLKRDWSIPALDIADRPDCYVRSAYDPRSQWYDDSNRAKAQELQYRYLRFSTRWIPNCHGLAQLQLVERFAKTNPEYFALKENGTRHDGSVVKVRSDTNGHICFSSKELQEVIYQDAKAFLSGEPAASRGLKRWRFHKLPFFNIMPNDSMARCRCPGCWPHFQDEQLYRRQKTPEAIAAKHKAGLFLWHWKLEIANRLKREGIEGYVPMMAYDLATIIPDEDIPDNVVLQVATTGPWNEVRPAAQAEGDQLLHDWRAKLGGKVYLWNYATKLSLKSLPLLPNSTPESVGRYYARNAKHTWGTFFECETDYRIFNHLNLYVFSRLMWDTGSDYQAILADYYQKMYGAAAATMQEFFQTLEKHWLIDCFNNEVMTSVGPKANPPTEYQIWNEIYSPAEISRIAAMFTKAESLAATDPAALQRVRFMRAQMWRPVEQGAEDYIRKTQAVDKWTAVLHTVPAGEKIVIDGASADGAWQSAAEVELLALGQDAVEVHTKVKMLQDDGNFYFLFWCEEPKTELMLTQERKFDDPMVWSDNAVEIHLDVRGKRQDAYQFMVNSLGVITDLHNENATLTNDYSYDSQAEAKSIIMDGVAWQTEIRIPKSSLPPVGADGRVIANFTRHRILRQEKVHLYYAWSPYALTFGDLANFGILIPEEKESNLLADGNFTYTGIGKTRPGEWFYWGKPFSRDTEIFRTAGVSLKLEHEDASLVYRLPFLKPFTQYRLNFFVRLADIVSSETGGGFYVRIDQGDGNVQYLPDPGYTGTLKWQRLEKIFTTGSLQPSTYNPYIHFCQRKSSGRTWIDAVQLVELGPAPDKK